MSKTKLAIMDDSQPQEEVKKAKVKTEKNTETETASENEAQSVEEAKELKTEDTSVNKTEEKPKKAQKPGKQKKVRSKKYQEIVKELDRSKSYPLNEAIEEAKKVSFSKFPGTLEIHINTNQTGLRGLVSLPFASGKKLTILAFGKNAADSGADMIGDESKIEEIGKGKIDFDLVVTSPDWMSKLAKVAKNLGPRGLMPTPKNGTISDDLKKAVISFQGGKTEYKSESKGKVIHLALGKLTQPTEELNQNIKVLVQTIGKTRVKKIALAPTMGPSVRLDLSSI